MDNNYNAKELIDKAIKLSEVEIRDKMTKSMYNISSLAKSNIVIAQEQVKQTELLARIAEALEKQNKINEEKNRRDSEIDEDYYDEYSRGYNRGYSSSSSKRYR